MDLRLSGSLRSLWLITCLVATPALAVTYIDNGNGTVTDPTTGLTWMRCAMGQTWTGSTCTGNAKNYTWFEASSLVTTFAGRSDWTLPSIRELRTILDLSRIDPSINTDAFPTPPLQNPYFWSKTTHGPFEFASNPINGWYSSFNSGYVGTATRDSTMNVRLALPGAVSNGLAVSRPDSDYVIHGNGTVTHTPSALMWQRCAQGQTWTGGTCDGSPTTHSWASAVAMSSNFAGFSDWRLPSINELETLIDYTTSDAVNINIFPSSVSTSNYHFYSASAFADTAASIYAWSIGFSFTGELNYNFSKNNPEAVRLVRTATAAPITATTTTATPTTSTTVASTTTTTQAGSSATLNLVAGWNLAGNSSTGSLNVASAFGDTAKVTTVWKWIASGAKWAFYAPTLVGQSLSDYATGKGYAVLTAISGGEGFWVNAKIAFTAQLPAGSAIPSASFQTMPSGWNLIALGDGKTPGEFNVLLSAIPPSPGVIPLNLTTLWTWDAAQSNWYFYAPSLEKSGGLTSYISSKSYLDFGTKVLDPTTGFWVNRP